MTETRKMDTHATDEYLRQIESRLQKQHLNPAATREILAELKSHLIDRVQELIQAGAASPCAQAIEAMGDPDAIAQEFLSQRSLRIASRSYAPGVLLGAAWKLTKIGSHSFLLFLGGLAGYGISVGFLLCAIAKLIFPDHAGFWVGDGVFVWGIPLPVPQAHEFAGPWFAPVSMVLAALVGAATTLLMQRQLRSIAVLRGK
jgi:uncharacterized membrane protein